MEQKIRKPVAWLLTLAMLFTMLPSFTFTALAADNLCVHHADHTAECGYEEGVSDCAYHCHVCHVQELIDALPGEVTAENAEAVAAQLTAIDSEKASLSDEELAQVDFAKYTAAAEALGSVYAAVPAEDATGTDTAADTTYPYAVVDTAAGTVTIDGTLGGKTTATEDDITALVDAIKGYVDSGITTIIVTGSEPALYNFYDVYTPAVSVAIFRLTEDSESSIGSGDPDSPYCGKIDLILQDVTEIVEMEFNNSFALNSITLPKVTKLGAQAFAQCNYLQTITFGSVVTEGIENGSKVFHEVGSKVDGGLCDLVLNYGQHNAAAEYQPNLVTNTWWDTGWKSISHAHTGGTATCTALAVCELCNSPYGEKATDNHTGTLSTYAPTADGSQHFATWDCCNKVETADHTAEPTYTVNEDDNTKHDVYYSCCGTFTEDHIGNPVAVDEFYHKYEGCCGAVDHTGMEADGVCDVCEFAQYDVWVDAIRITSLNKDDVLNDSGSLKYAPDTYTLTVSGNVTVSDSFNDGINNYGIYAENGLIITGNADSSLTVGGDTVTYGVYVASETAALGVNGGMTLSATGSDAGIQADTVGVGTNLPGSEPNDTSKLYATGGNCGIRASSVEIYDTNLVTVTGSVGIAAIDADSGPDFYLGSGGHLIVNGTSGALSLGDSQSLDFGMDSGQTAFWRFDEGDSFESSDENGAFADLGFELSLDTMPSYLEIIASNDMTYADGKMTCSHGEIIDVVAKLEYTYSNKAYTLYFSDLQSAINAANGLGSAMTDIKLTLLGNVTVTDAPLTITDDLPLDLAGYQISGNINGALLEVATNENANTTGALTITDSSTGKTGSISNTHTDGIGVKVSAGTLTIGGGTITGTKAGIYLANGVSSITVASSDISGSTVDMETPGLFATAGTGVTLKADMFTSARDGYIVDQGDSGLSLVVCDHSGSQHESATDKGDGTHSFTCTVCGDTESEAHTLAYSASGSVITANCSKCNVTLGTATISATGKNYNGTVLEATVTKTGSLENEAIAITYAVKDGATLESAPKNAGTYTASITMGEGENAVTASVDFTIATADPSYTVPADLTATYGDTLADVTLPEGWAWEDDTLSVGEVGTNAFDAIFTPTDTANYNTVSDIKVTIQVEKATPTVDAPAAISGLVYSGDAQTLVTAGSTNGGTLQYKVGEDGTYGTAIPTATDAGTYTIYYKVVGNDNYNDVDAKSVEVTINPKNISIVGATIEDVVYNAAGDYTLNVTGVTFEGATLTLGTDYTATAELTGSNEVANGVAATVTVSLTNGNYTLSTNTFTGKVNIVEHTHVWGYELSGTDTIVAKCSGTIGQCPVENKTVTITLVAPDDLSYDGEAKSVTVNQNPTDFFNNLPDVVYTGDCTGTGDHTAKLTYGGVTATLTFTIEKATISNITVDVTAPVAGAEPQTTVTAGTGYSAEIKWNETVTQFGFNTAYTATVTLTADSNHKFTDNLSVDGWNAALNSDNTVATLTKTFEATRKAKLTELTNAPANKTLTAYHADANGAISELPTTVTYTTESGNVTVDIAWTCDNYNSATKATNTFAWSVKAGELDDYDVNNIATSGTITVTNVDALPVNNTGSDDEITYANSTYDVSKMFTKDANAGEASYAITDGTGAGTLNGSTLTITKAGTIEITMTTAANGIYAAGSVTATLTVNKANAAVTTAPTANELTYTGSAQDLIHAGSAKGGEMQYSTDNQTWSDTIPQGTDAGEYTVYYKVVGDVNHNDTAAKYVTVTIAKAELTATISGSVTKVYDGTNAVPSEHGLSITLNTLFSNDNVTASASYIYDGVNVGTTKINATGITLSGADASNYVLTNTTASADVGTITKAAAPAIVWPTASSLVYGQTLSDSALTSTDSNGTFAWKNGSTVPTVTNNGYVVVYTPKDMDNYDYSNVTLEKTISVTVTAADQADFSISGATTATYGDAAITLNAAGGSGDGTITWEITSGDQFASIDQNGVVTIKGAGTVTVKATKAADGNYKEKVDTHQITISKATVDADNFAYKAPTDLVYSKTEKVATVTGDEAYGAITIKYYSDSSLTTVVQPINVGTYYVGITTAGGDNYEAVTAPMYVGSFTITARTVTVTAAAKTMQYGDNVPELTYTHNLIEGDSFTGSLATTATKTSDVGEYDITIGDLANSNYSISFTGAKLTITKADGPAAPTVTGSYKDNGMTYTYTVDAISGAEYSKDGTTWQDSNVFANLVAGQKYTFYARIKETTNVLAGAIGTSAEVDLSKLPGKGTVTIDDWTYGETAQAPVTGSTTGNAVESYLYESTDGKGYSSANAPTNTGEYKLTVTFAATDTHNGTTASDTFTIKKATPVVDAPTGLTATYGDTLASVQLPEGWAWKDAATTEVGNAGENTFAVIYTKDDSGNYNTVEKTVTITVAPKVVTATVTVVGENFIFNGSEQKPGVTVKDGDITISESEYTVSYTNNTNAGTATVTVTDKDGGNYTVTGESTFAIAKKASSALSGVEREFMRTIATTGNEIDVEAMLPDDHGTTTYTITSSGYTVLENVAVDANGKLVFDTKTSAAAASDTITVKVEMQNYTDVTLTVSVILNDKAPQEITGVTAETSLIYNGEAQKGYTGTPASDYTGAYEITYTGRDNSYNSSAAPVNAGDYTVTFKIPDSDLYYSGNISINFTIGKAQATVTADDKEAYVGNRMPELTYKVVGLIGSDTISVELSCDANMNRAGETPIVVTATDPNGNYEITTVNGTLTVKYYPYIPSTPSNPPATEVTVPISGDDNTIHVEAEVSGDKAIIDHVDLDHLDEVIGDHVDTGTVTIDFSGLDTKEPITTVEIPANVVKEIASAVNDPNNDADSLEIILSDGTSIEFDAEALGEKAAQARGQDITISIESHEDVRLTNAQKNALGNRPAYDINVTSGGKHISDMGGKITVHAPYELKSGEKAEGIVVYYVDENGNRERCETSYDPIKKRVNWKTDHLSLYMIDYDENIAVNFFTDVAEGTYYYDAVLWAVKNSITSGTSATTFSPDMTCTRAQAVTFLWRAAGSPEPESAKMPFEDVAVGAYYYKAVLWAVENGITNGTSATSFSPDNECTRSQIVTFLWRSQKSPAASALNPFNDVAAKAYYYDAVLWAVDKKITSGTSATTFSPDADCTRAQIVTFLYRCLSDEE